MSSYPSWSENTHNPEPGRSIHGGTFIENVNNIVQTGDTGLHILYNNVSLEAIHDSADNDAQPKCYPETRTKMLEKLYNWCIASEWFRISDYWRALDDPRREVLIKGLSVLWLYGPAGAGKSVIMRTLAEHLAECGQLGGSFFFKRGHPTCGNAQKLFTTLAYQLADNVPQIKPQISKIVANTPSVVSKSLKVQLLKLVTEPCRKFDTSRPITFIIDGLDECNDPGVQQEVLRSIGNSIRKQDLFPLQFVIANRLEPHIHEIFQGSLFHKIHHSFNVDNSFEDVRTYLEDEFARIHREHHETMAGVSSPWPSQEVIEYLLDKSSGYFIYASTVIKFVDDRNFRPTEKLKALMDASHLESPFSALDQLYTQILSAVPAHHRLLPILRALEFFDFRLHPGGIEQVLELKPGDVQLILRGLHSVLDVPKYENDNGLWEISVHHASFRDFLNDQSRSGKFYVGGLQHEVEVGKSVLKALSYTYDNPEINLVGPVALDVGLRRAISKIPPLLEMIPLIRLLNPIPFFLSFKSGAPDKILSLLENIGNPPADLVQLWEDYKFMESIEDTIIGELGYPQSDNGNLGLSTKGFPQLSRCVLLPCLLQTYILGHGTKYILSLINIHLLLDISWTDLRATMCPLRHIIGCADPEAVHRLLCFVTHHLSPETVIRQLSMDLVRGFIGLIKDKGKWVRNLGYPWGRLIRVSPHSMELLQDMCQVSFSPDELKRGENSPENYHNTLQWLKAFPEPSQDVIEVWKQYLIVASKRYEYRWQNNPQYDLETEWREWHANFEKWFPHLRGQTSGK
ncbi:hypothetical protein C8J57DRAFT_1724212 [Mycena rebaudengoi]|nr:hypothetical protein C8J57DRAFT_1724212 [Mycena rebaudengoi]